MCIVEIVALVMLIGGIVAMITGKVQLTKNKQVTGVKARIVGGFMVLTLPLMLTASLTAGVITAFYNQDEDAIAGVAAAAMLITFIPCVILTIALILAWADPVNEHPNPYTGQPPHPTPPPQPTAHLSSPPPNDPPPSY